MTTTAEIARLLNHQAKGENIRVDQIQIAARPGDTNLVEKWGAETSNGITYHTTASDLLEALPSGATIHAPLRLHVDSDPELRQLRRGAADHNKLLQDMADARSEREKYAKRLESAQETWHEAIRRAARAGMSKATIAEANGLTRAYIYKIIDNHSKA